MVRGALVPHIFRKTLKLPYSIAKESAAATLMSTDIEGISTGIPQIHKMWACLIEVCVGLYLLATIIDKATFLVVLPVLGKIFLISVKAHYIRTSTYIAYSFFYYQFLYRKRLRKELRYMERENPGTSRIDHQGAFTN